jgi:tripartite-type tricarboxylate transporter receptor subunit TctC
MGITKMNSFLKNNLPCFKVLHFLGPVLLGLFCTASVMAQFPQKPIRVIVPQASGSASDVTARMLVHELSLSLNQSIFIDNKPGGGFTIGLDLLAKAAPDGYTLGVGPVGAMVISPNMMSKMPYDIERDFQPIALITRGHLLLAVSPQLPVNSVAELIAYAKKYPNKLSNASSSNGSPGHVGGELFKLMSGTQITHIPYKGGAMAINDLMSGQVDMIFESLNSISVQAKAGKVKALGVSGAHRSPAFPNIPTIAEAGVPGYEAPTWIGVFGPAGTPKNIVDKLNQSINQVIASTAFKERFGAIGDELAGGSAEELGEFMKQELQKWKEVVKKSGAKFD